MSLKLVLLLLLGLSLQSGAWSLPEDQAEAGAFPPSMTKSPYNEWVDENSDVLNQLDQMVYQLASLATQEWGQLKRMNFDELVTTVGNYVAVHGIEGLAGKDWNELTRILITELPRLNLDDVLRYMVHEHYDDLEKLWDTLRKATRGFPCWGLKHRRGRLQKMWDLPDAPN